MDKIKSQLESLLFVAAKPLSLKQLVECLGVEEEKIKEACEQLSLEYKENNRGILLTKGAGKYQLATSPESAEVVQKFVQAETSGELSRPSLEALTIIAYRSPVTKSELDRIRGVNCSLILRNLLVRGLVETKEDKGETYYSVSLDFLRFLGLGSVEELPNFQHLHSDQIIDQVLAKEEDSL